MKLANKSIIAAALAGIVALANNGTPLAAEAPTHVTLKPMSGPAAPAKGQQVLLNMRVGTKQAVSYFQAENGRCKLTIMVADAFNGIEVPSSPTIRFEIAIGAGRTALMDTAEGGLLEFACRPRAQEMNVRAGHQISVYPPGT